MRRRNVGWVIYFAAALLVNLLFLIIYLANRPTDQLQLSKLESHQQEHRFTEAERRLAAEELERAKRCDSQSAEIVISLMNFAGDEQRAIESGLRGLACFEELRPSQSSATSVEYRYRTSAGLRRINRDLAAMLGALNLKGSIGFDGTALYVVKVEAPKTTPGDSSANLGQSATSGGPSGSSSGTSSSSGASGASSSGSDQPLPDFPWPPPTASAWAEIPGELLAGGAAQTLGDINKRLGHALDAAGYRQRSVFAVPAGFAIVTQLERIDDDGVPADSSRWQLTEASTAFSLVSYVKRLLHAEPGRYRLVVLVVSSVPFSATGAFMTASEAFKVVTRGLNALPVARAAKKYEANDVVTALIYEFRKMPVGEPEFVAPSALPGYEHLVRARIWAHLADTKKN